MRKIAVGAGRWLAQTQLLPPPIGPDVIARPRLIARLWSALRSSRLTMVSAPAGYGKTTLLATLSTILPDVPRAWLSLDAEDGDPARFLAALVLAFRRSLPRFGISALSQLSRHSTGAFDPRYAVGAIVTELLERAPHGCLLVLDDLHLVSDPRAYEALDHLLEWMPPLGRIAVATRRETPLALPRLRGRGLLAELRLSDLRFTLDEVDELLNDRLGLALEQGDVDRLYELSEGWPAAIRLLAGSLRRLDTPAERSSFIAGVAPRDRYLFDYLAAEVLDRHDPGLRTFLLETSILSELTPRSCQAVTCREDAPRIPEGLDRRGLLVVPVDQSGATLRYHGLFASFLQRELHREMPDRVAELHLRAARASTTPSRAIAHYLAAECWAEAARVVEKAAGALLRDGLADTVASWISAIPPIYRAGRPRLGLALGGSALLHGDLPTARIELEHAVDGLRDTCDDATGEAVALLASCALLQADLTGARTIAESGLASVSLPYQRVQLLVTHCHVAALQRSWAEALADVDGALHEVGVLGNKDAMTALGLALRPELATLPGGIDRIECFIRRVVSAVGPEATPLRVAVHELEGLSHFWRGRLDAALAVCDRALAEVRRLGGNPFLGLNAAGFCAIARLARGDPDAAALLVDFVLERLAVFPLGRVYVAGPLYWRGKACLARGDHRGARLACQDMWAAASDQESTVAETLRWKLRGWLAMAECHYGEAERALHEALAAERRVLTATLFGTARLPLAMLAYQQEREEEALAQLAPVMEECRRQDTAGVLLMDGGEVAPLLRLAVQRNVHAAYAAWLLSVLEPGASTLPTVVPNTGQVLSPRELDVLSLLVAGASNRAIAERLVIAETTVKSHVTNILRKLDVSSRTQAAARARELKICLPCHRDVLMPRRVES